MLAGELYAALGFEIRARRRKSGLTQQDLATALGLSRPSIANIEGGRQVVAVHQLLAIAYELDVRPETMFGKAIAKTEASNRAKVSESLATEWNLSPTEMKIVQKMISKARTQKRSMEKLPNEDS